MTAEAIIALLGALAQAYPAAIQLAGEVRANSDAQGKAAIDAALLAAKASAMIEVTIAEGDLDAAAKV